MTSGCQPSLKKQRTEEDMSATAKVGDDLDSLQLNKFSRQIAAMGKFFLPRSFIFKTLPLLAFTEEFTSALHNGGKKYGI